MKVRETEKDKIILYHPQTHHEKNYQFFWAPYSLLSVAAPLVRDGYAVEIWDNNVANKTDYKKELTSALRDAVCVGVSSMIGHQITDGLDFSKQVKEISPETPVVWGGPLPSLLPGLVLDTPDVDFVVRGQGSSSFRDLVTSIQEGTKDLPTNVGYKLSQSVFEGTKGKLDDLNKLPPYPFALLNMENYVRDDPQISGRVLNYVSSLGCAWGCGFCTDTAVYEKRWSGFTAQRTFEETSYLVETHDLTGVKFYDSNFFMDTRRALEFATLIKEKQINWAASAHPKNILSLKDNELNLLKESGLRRLLIGAESGIQDELDLIGKKIKVQDIREVAEILSRKEITASFTFVIGYPDMPRENLQTTLRFAEKLAEEYSGHEYKVHLYLPFPGTPLYERAMTFGFKPPESIEGWANLDYYEQSAPWVSKEDESRVRSFNEKFCPYV